MDVAETWTSATLPRASLLRASLPRASLPRAESRAGQGGRRAQDHLLNGLADEKDEGRVAEVDDYVGDFQRNTLVKDCFCLERGGKRKIESVAMNKMEHKTSPYMYN